MSEQSRLAFESIYPVPDGLWFHKDGDYINKQDTPNDYNNMWHTWQAATAESNKRIAALESEVAELKSTVKKWQENSVDLEYRCLDKNILIAELQASNKVLREQLETALTSLKERET